MGYYALSIKAEPIRITNPTAVLDNLQSTEPEHGHSWCQPVARYRATATDDTQALLKFVEDMGFHADTDDNVIEVYAFGDSKMGTSWDEVWPALAIGTDQTDVVWIMCGEDGEIWAELITTDGYRQAYVNVSYDVKV